MTPKAFRHCAIVRLLARAGPRPERMIKLEERQAWVTDLEQLDAELGAQLAAALNRRDQRFVRSRSPDMEAQDVAAILDLCVAQKA